MSHLSDRRVSPRCDAVQNRSCLAFGTPNGSRRIDARLVNISRSGALVVADNPPAAATRVLLRIETPAKTEWVDARVIRVDPNRHIGLRFSHDCPDDVLLTGTVTAFD